VNKLLNYLWPVLLGIYIISPIDAHPLFLDDLIASAVLFYFIYKNAKHKKQQQYYNYNQSQSNQSQQKKTGSSYDHTTLDGACKLLGVSPSASLDDISRAYKDKMAKSHPDKVSHLSVELQEKAKELTLKLNEAYDLLKQYKKN
jgi:DnaJ-domain-containing protein 1